MSEIQTRKDLFDRVVREVMASYQKGDPDTAKRLLEQWLLTDAQTALDASGDSWPERDQFATIMEGRVVNGLLNGLPLGAVVWGALWAAFHTGYRIGLDEAEGLAADLQEHPTVEAWSESI